MTELREFDQTELERARRIRQIYAADRPSEQHVARVVSRLGVRRSRPLRAQALRVAWIAAGLTLISLGALAAAGVVKPSWFSSPKSSVVAGTTPVALVRPGTPGNEPTSVVTSTKSVPAPNAVPSADPPRASTSPQKPNHTPGEAAPAELANGAWSRAAAALRDGDRQRAQLALAELAKSPDARTRDAALLAQAELDLGGGAAESARAVLANLATNGATPYVRERARQILAEKK